MFESPTLDQRADPVTPGEAEAFAKYHLHWLECDDSRVQGIVARHAGAVQWLVCLAQENVQIGTYAPSGDPAYRVDLAVRVLQWPSGKLVARQDLRGSEEALTVPYDDVLEYLGLAGAGAP